MKNSNIEDIERLLSLPRTVTVDVFDQYVAVQLRQNEDQRAQITQLEQQISELHNHVLLLSVLVKQRYTIPLQSNQPKEEQHILYTKQEVAIKFRVTLRTVHNWIREGLKVTSIGGVVRINQMSLKEFMETKKNKKNPFPH